MPVLNNMSRYQLVLSAIARISDQPGVATLTNWCKAELDEHAAYILDHGLDMPEVRV